MIRMLTLGTTSLNHGFGDNNSANQVAVEDPTSFERLWISHSVTASAVDQSTIPHPYLGNEHQLQDDFEQALPVDPTYSYPTPPLASHELRR